MKNLEEALSSECHKIIHRFELYATRLREEDVRRLRRGSTPAHATILRPDYWSVDRSFDPYLVRSSTKAIARALKLGLSEHTYQPFNPLRYEVPKSDGSMREVSVFAIADAVVSNRIFRAILNKNRTRLSAYSYAYRPDLSLHDAVRNIAADLKSGNRLFVAEYDFSKYFQNILHEHIWQTVEQRGFLLSPLERNVLDKFLKTQLQDQNSYARQITTSAVAPARGIPQGTSVSLFLANLAAWDLDRALERLGIGFARYADDTLIWSHDYGRICEASAILNDMSSKIGAPINFAKSAGISIYAPGGSPAEFKSKTELEFIGYRFTAAGTGMRTSTANRAKRRISYIIYSNLLEPLKLGSPTLARVSGGFDRDYLVAIMQIRRYLYGGMTERKLSRLAAGPKPRITFPGFMSFFPLIDDVEQLRDLDGWLLTTMHTTLKARRKLFQAAGISALPYPHALTRDELPRAQTKSSKGQKIDLRMPSFVRIGAVIRAAADAHGANAISKSGGPQTYDYMS